MEILVNGMKWVLKFSRLRGRASGWCYYDSSKILIDKSLRGERRLDVLIHEMLHAHHRAMSEEAVAQTATDIARVLWELGYRSVDEV